MIKFNQMNPIECKNWIGLNLLDKTVMYRKIIKRPQYLSCGKVLAIDKHGDNSICPWGFSTFRKVEKSQWLPVHGGGVST